MSSSLKGWHPGEAAIQSQLHYSSAVKDAFELSASSLPAEQVAEHSTLILLPLVTLDPQGRPWVSILTSSTGEPGFVSSHAANMVVVAATPWDGDPLNDNLQHYEKQKTSKILVAGAAVNLHRVGPRNKFSGTIREFHRGATSWSIVMEVNQTLGNSNRYLSIRGLDVYPAAMPIVEYCKRDMEESERLPDKLIELIHRVDTMFFGTSYVAVKKDEKRFPSRLSLNHRGGRPGFLRVRPNDGRTIVLPDYSGNHVMNSLGNIEATPVASLAIPCFTSGDVLYLTGTARNFVGKRAQALMHRVNVLTTVKVTGFIYVHNALPFREREGSFVQSPYCPPIRMLTEEKPGQTHYKGVSARISQVVLKSQDIAIFSFEASREISIKPGEWVMLDFSFAVGRPAYPQPNVVSEAESRELHDDRVRTWTVSSHSSSPSKTFEIMMQRKPDGLVTGYMFDLAHSIAGGRLDTVVPIESERPGKLRLVSTGGDFILPKKGSNMLWIAGGIGITPFVSLLQAVEEGSLCDVEIVLASRSPDIHIPLLTSSLSSAKMQPKISLHLYSIAAPTIPTHPAVHLYHHPPRFNRGSLKLDISDITTRDIWICTPKTLYEVVLDGLIDAEADINRLRYESFMW
ncbi:hypothetical protein K439DRAFT_1411496 [Ramaria rubella]|nr:hypothetical protein K439DRAFT_1411496 [Ramaria rubella]